MFSALQQCLEASGLAEQDARNESVKQKSFNRPPLGNTLSKPLGTTFLRKTLFRNTKRQKLLVEPCPSSGKTPSPVSKHMILKLDTMTPHSDLAVGIVCRMDISQGLCAAKSVGSGIIEEPNKDKQPNQGRELPSTGKSVMAAAALPYHCVCILKREKATQTVMDCFSVVEFKKDNLSCDELLGNAGDVESKHSALAQVLSDTVQYVLNYHARRGYLPDYLAWAVLARKKKPAVQSNVAQARKSNLRQPREEVSIRWVYGAVKIPEACGDRFVYTINDDDGQYQGSDNNKQTDPYNRCLSMYLDTLLFGIKTAIKVYDDLMAMHPSPPVSASGKQLVIGKVELKDCTLVASSIHGAHPIPRPTGNVAWFISQGDLFQGRFNVSTILKEVPDEDKAVFNTSKGDMDVLVKVSSTAAHGLLVQPIVAFQALKLVKGVEKLSHVLYAAIEMKSGLIIVMKNLSNDHDKHGYKILKPRKFEGKKLWFLWQGFITFVADFLLPMAHKSVVHLDIRPGYDVTSNILCKDCEEAVQVPLLVLIDYESLVKHGQWVNPNYDKHVSYDTTWNAITFVIWQSVAVAYAWYTGLTQCDINVNLMFPINNKMHWLPDHILQVKFLPFYRPKVKTLELDLEEALKELAKLFTII